MNYAGSTCICRVPKAQLKDGVVVECTHCGAYEKKRVTLTCVLIASPFRVPRLRVERLKMELVYFILHFFFAHDAREQTPCLFLIGTNDTPQSLLSDDYLSLDGARLNPNLAQTFLVAANVD